MSVTTVKHATGAYTFTREEIAAEIERWQYRPSQELRNMRKALEIGQLFNTRDEALRLIAARRLLRQKARAKRQMERLF